MSISQGSPPSGPLHTAFLGTEQELAALIPEWQGLCRDDPEANFFLSPEWLAPALRDRPGRWLLLSARDAEGRLTGLLPLWRMRFQHRETGAIWVELMAAGRMVWSEYSGFLCAPGAGAATLHAFADALEGIDWATLSLPYLAQHDRAEIFAARLAAAGHGVEWPRIHINDGATDSLRCPRLDLPPDYESWLRDSLGASTRQKLRRMTRRHLDSGALRIVPATPETLPRHLDFTLAHWRRRWSASTEAVERYRRIFTGAMARGQLSVPVLLRGDRPIGSLVNIVDRAGGYTLFKLAARDAAFADIPIGLLLHAHAIREAIAQRHRVYDFGHGNEPYKYGFGARDLPLRTLRIHRRPKAPSR